MENKNMTITTTNITPTHEVKSYFKIKHEFLQTYQIVL